MTGIGVKSVQYEANADFNTTDALVSSFGNNNFKIYTYSTGADMPNPTNVEELKKYYADFFAKSKDYKRRVKYVVLPYSVLQDYPYPDILQGDTKEAYIGYMADALWDLKAAMKDADFILDRQTRSLFALGTRNTTRNRRVHAIQRYKKAWRKEFDDLLKAAQKCDKNFNKQCEQLAAYYRDDRGLRNLVDRVMPERYVNDCYTPILLDLNEPPTNVLLSELQMKHQFDTVAGDTETGGNHVRVVAALDFRPDNRKLIGDLRIAKIEWKRTKHTSDWKGRPLEVRTKKGESGFGLRIQKTVFDLDNPQQYGLPFDRKLTTCTWDKHRPVKVRHLYKEPVGKNGFERYGFRGQLVYGLIDSLSKRNARGQSEYGPGKGILTSIRCAVDAKGRHDDRLGCESARFKTVELNLVSKQDLAADRWRDPQAYAEPAILANFLKNRTIRYRIKHRPQLRSYSIPSSEKKYLKIQAKSLKPVQMAPRHIVPMH